MKLLFLYQILVDCPSLKIANGDVVIDRERNPSVAAYVCDTGYIINDTSLRTCGSNGMWLGRQRSCQSKRARIELLLYYSTFFVQESQ